MSIHILQATLMYLDTMLAIINSIISTTWVYRENGILIQRCIELDYKLPTLNVHMLV